MNFSQYVGYKDKRPGVWLIAALLLSIISFSGLASPAPELLPSVNNPELVMGSRRVAKKTLRLSTAFRHAGLPTRWLSSEFKYLLWLHHLLDKTRFDAASFPLVVTTTEITFRIRSTSLPSGDDLPSRFIS